MDGWRPFLTSIGIDDASTIAGFAGGVVKGLGLLKVDVTKVITLAVTGALIGNYIGKPIAEAINATILSSISFHIPVVPLSFVIGYMGVTALDYVISFGRQKLNGGTTASSGGPKDASV